MTKLLNLVKKYKEFILLLVLSLLLFQRYIFHPQDVIYPSGDIWGQYYLWKWLIVTNVKEHGILTLWNPYSFSGTPLLGNPLTGMFYPSIIFFFIFPIIHIFGYIFILDFFIIGIFTFLFARSIHMTRLSSFVSASVFMLSGSLVTRVFAGHFANIETIIWFPALFYLFEKAYTSRKVVYVLFLGLSVCLMILAGHTQFMFYALTSYVMYALLRIILVRKSVIKNIVLLVLTPILIGSLISFIQLLPSFELSHWAVRTGGVTYKFASSFSLHPLQLITLFLPHFFGGPTPEYYWGKGNFWELCGYIGIIPLFFAGYSLQKIKKNRFILILTLLALFSLLFSLGKYFVIFPFFYHFIPLFNLFRIPATFLFVYSFCIALLCGLGIEIILSKKYSKKFNRFSLIVAVVTLLLAVLSILVLIHGRQYTTPLMILHLNKYFLHGVPVTVITNFIVKDLIVFSLFLTGLLLTLFLIYKKGNINLIKLLLIIVTIGNVFVFSQSLIFTKSFSSFVTPPSYIPYIQNDYRVYNHIDTSVPAILAQNNVKSILGSDPSYLAFYRDFMWNTGDHLEDKYEPFLDMHSLTNITPIELLNTKYLVTNDKLQIGKEGPLNNKPPFIYELQNPYGHAYIVPNAIIEDNETERLSIISKNKIDFKENVLIEKNITSPLKNSQKYLPVKISNYSPNEIALSLPPHQAGYLVLSEVWYPGWNAYINGKRVEILKANQVLRAIYVTPQAKSVVYKYEPQSLKIGMLVSGTTLLFTIGLLIYARRKKLLF